MSLIIGSQVPRRGNAFSRGLGHLLLWIMGWRAQGSIPNLSKMVLIGAPHTTNMDGVIALATITAYGLQAGTMIKDSAFKGLMGPLLRWFGAIPINRRSAKGVVEQSADAFTNNEKLLLLIAPEGTRHSAADWKRGYYLIAAKAGVPIVPVACDYRRKTINFGEPVYPTEGYDADNARILDFIAKNGYPHHPERLSKPLCERMGRTWQPREDKD